MSSARTRQESKKRTYFTFLLWMIASPPTWQNWKKQKLWLWNIIVPPEKNIAKKEEEVKLLFCNYFGFLKF
jgi:hypothetical protein